VSPDHADRFGARWASGLRGNRRARRCPVCLRPVRGNDSGLSSSRACTVVQGSGSPLEGRVLALLSLATRCLRSQKRGRGVADVDEFTTACMAEIGS
jgi:hypothetical protein